MAVADQLIASLSAGIRGNETAYKWTNPTRISFSIKKTRRRKPNQSQIKIYNLNTDSQGFLDQDDLTVILRAGFNSEPGILLWGDIGDVTHKRDGTDVVTTISADDGGMAYNRGFINKSFEGPVKNTEVLKSALSQLGLGIGHIAQLAEFEFTNGYTATGMVRDVMSELVESVNASWSIQNNTVQILNSEQGTNEEAVVLTPDTGLIGEPQTRKSRGKGSKGGIDVRARLDSGIAPGRYVKIVSEYQNGFFKVNDCTYSGDTRGGDAVVSFVATRVTLQSTSEPQGQPTFSKFDFSEPASWIEDVFG